MSALKGKVRVAIFDQFLDSFATIPRAQQKKVNNFIRKFRADPTSRAINYEKIHEFVDQNLRSVRIDEAYRAIVLKPEQGNVYVLLWVDHHDEAMAWAKSKRIEIHPETGSLQVLTLEATPAAAPAAAPAAPKARERKAKLAPALFDALADAEILGLGVPELLLARVRELRDLAALEELGAAAVPPEAFEALYWIASGDSLEDVRRALEPAHKKAVDVQDFAVALENEASKRRFVVVENEDELAAMLDAPLEKWRVFLHPTQRALVEGNRSGPVRVTGGAGTGKTVVAMHRAAWLTQKVFTKEDDRILFTTYTRNLAADIHESLTKLVPPRVMARIEVVNLDKWVEGFLSRHGYGYTIEYFEPGRSPLWELWSEALSLAPEGAFPQSFYREEWEYVVQPQGITSVEAYLEARRASRGVRLARGQRKAIWAVFAEYRNLLEEKRLREATDAMRDAIGLLERKEATAGYRAIVVDEAQDMSTTAFELLRKLIPDERANDIFIVGDAHQRIYRRQVVLGHAGIRVVGRSFRLRVNYRTTDEIRRYAVALLEGTAVDDLDGGLDSMKGYKSLIQGSQPEVIACKAFDKEVDAIVKVLGAGDPSKTCLVARTRELVAQYEAAIQARGVPVYLLKRAQAENHAAPGLRIATMHRVKGLEFDRVIVAGVNEGIVPLASAIATTDDPAVREDMQRQERALLYVALTRARRAAVITCFDKPSPWILGSAGSTV